MLDLWRGTLSPRRVMALVRNLPRDSATYTCMQGESWSTGEHLTALAVDALRIANWQRTEDGSKGRNYPQPVRRPGVERPNETRIGGGSWTLDEMRTKLAEWPGRRRTKLEVISHGD